MNLNRKVTVFSVIMASALVSILTLISLYSFRQYSLIAATEHVRTAAEIIRVNLTEAMIHGVIDRREGFLGRLREVEGFKSARIARAPELEQQFGPGTPREVAMDDIERRVMETREPDYRLLDSAGETLFRGTIPYVASSHGLPNCLQCHEVNEGTVLGTVSITFSIDHLKRRALLTVAGISGVVLAFALVAWYLLRRYSRPVSETARDVELAVQRALDGNFRGQVQARTRDEIGNIADNLNRLMEFLAQGLDHIATRVGRLIEREPVDGENQLKATREMVDILSRAARFKQAIEEDETRAEIHGRLAGVLRDEFSVEEFSLYEVTADKNQLRPLLVDGVADAPCRWCDPEILVRGEACRALRTGHAVDGLANPGLCYAFRPPGEAADRGHICLPIMQSGSVGNVLQIVAPRVAETTTAGIIPFVNLYLREAAPVLESKRLMETLREANLRDPMTGLNNRRFLEEYLDTLLAQNQRHKTHLSILMLDLDYFKMVNDSHGHDAGDTVLKALARALRESVRGSDMVIRYGGEEFLILLQETGAEAAMTVAETIRARVESLKIPIGAGTTLQKTISIGVADFPEDSPTFWQALKFADVALYQAKETGRNRVVRFVPAMWDETQSY